MSGAGIRALQHDAMNDVCISRLSEPRPAVCRRGADVADTEGITAAAQPGDDGNVTAAATLATRIKELTTTAMPDADAAAALRTLQDEAAALLAEAK